MAFCGAQILISATPGDTSKVFKGADGYHYTHGILSPINLHLNFKGIKTLSPGEAT